jgi:hypothetical protein
MPTSPISRSTSRPEARGSCRLAGTVLAAFAAVLPALSAPAGEAACRPPSDLLVCQDQYGQLGRAFLAWRNGETSYTAVRVYLDGRLAGEVAGHVQSGYISGLAPGEHTFAVEGACGDAVSSRISATFTLLSATPHERPAAAVACSYDAERGRLTADIEPGPRPSLFIDVYLRRAGSSGLVYVRSVLGDTRRISVDGALATDRLLLQFFDLECYASGLVGCDGAAACEPLLGVRVCQDVYGSRPRLFVGWTAGAAPYTAFEVFAGGSLAAVAGGNRTFAYLDEVALGEQEFAVRGVCGAEATPLVARRFEVLASSPHLAPLEDLRCAYDAATRSISAAWRSGPAPSEFIDLYLRRPGNPVLAFAGTIAGMQTRTTVTNAAPEEQLVLQFFSAACYGSPLITCSSAGSGAFLRGDANGDGRLDLSDAIFTLAFLFLGGPAPLCPAAADANDGGALDIADPIFTLGWLFTGGPPPPPPGPAACGLDPTPDALGTCLTAACP